MAAERADETHRADYLAEIDGRSLRRLLQPDADETSKSCCIGADDDDLAKAMYGVDEKPRPAKVCSIYVLLRSARQGMILASKDLF